MISSRKSCWLPSPEILFLFSCFIFFFFLLFLFPHILHYECLEQQLAVKEGGGLGWLGKRALESGAKVAHIIALEVHRFNDFEQQHMLGAPGWL